MRSIRSSGEAPKIVQIETRYVETDATNFRDVVQSLTGKNSSTAWIGQPSNNNNNNTNAAAAAAAATSSHDVRGRGTATAKPQVVEEAAAATTSYSKEAVVVPNSSMLTNNISFKDFDRLLFEFPSGDMESALPWL